MKQNMKKSPASAADKLARRRKLRYGTYATVITAVFVAIVVALNVVAGILAERFPLRSDLTAGKDFSISEKNRDYIEGISRDVTVTLCATESDYTGGNYAALISSSNISDTSSGMFFNQTVRLLKEYARLSDHVTLKFVDPQSPDFSDYTTRYADESFSLGDILIESTFTLEGKKMERHRKLGFYDLYDIDSTYSSYGMYYLTGSKVETAVTSAIYAATSDKTYKVAVITANGGDDIGTLASIMKQNNYEVVEITDIIIQKIPKEADMLVIAAPNRDYSADQLKMLEDYLDTRGNLGKNLLYIASNKYGEMPNLYDFLAEWGFSVGTGTVVETNDSNSMGDELNTIQLFDSGSDYTKSLEGVDYTYLFGNNVPITNLWEENENTATTTVLATGETAKVNKDSKQIAPFTAVGVSTFTMTLTDDAGEYQTAESNVIVVSSIDIIESNANVIQGVGNLDLLMSTVNTALGREASDISFDTRTYSSLNFTVNQTATNIIFIVFVVVIPLALLATCIAIFVRRRRL